MRPGCFVVSVPNSTHLRSSGPVPVSIRPPVVSGRSNYAGTPFFAHSLSVLFFYVICSVVCRFIPTPLTSHLYLFLLFVGHPPNLTVWGLSDGITPGFLLTMPAPFYRVVLTFRRTSLRRSLTRLTDPTRSVWGLLRSSRDAGPEDSPRRT